MPGVGIEPTRADKRSLDFKSRLSTNFSTRANRSLKSGWDSYFSISQGFDNEKSFDSHAQAKQFACSIPRRSGRESNPRVGVLQTPALPLRHQTDIYESTPRKMKTQAAGMPHREK